MLPLACLALGVILGLIGGLQVALALLAGMTKRLEELEQRRAEP